MTISPVVSPTVIMNAGQTIMLFHSNTLVSLLNISVTSPASNSSISNQSPGSSGGNRATTISNQGIDILPTETLFTVCGTLARGAPPEAASTDLDAKMSKVACYLESRLQYTAECATGVSRKTIVKCHYDSNHQLTSGPWSVEDHSRWITSTLANMVCVVARVSINLADRDHPLEGRPFP